MAGVLQSFTNVGKGFAVTIVAGGLAAQASPFLQDSLGLIAARAIPRPWTLLTCAFVNSNIVSSLAYAVAVLFLARIVEPIYGPRELVKYLSAVVICSSFLTMTVITILYYASSSSKKSSSTKADHAGDMLFRPMGGFEAGLAALLVAVKQLIPDNEVALLGGALKFRAKHLPGLYVTAMVGTSLVLGGAVRIIPFTLFGTYLAWAFLRFVQTRNGMRGDLSDEFRLATFFPQPLQPPIDQVARTCTHLTGLGGSAGGGSAQHPAAWNYAMSGSVLPGTDDNDAARRREKGAKALEERLGIKKAASTASVPAAASGSQEAVAAQPAAAADVEAGVAPKAAS